MKEKKLFLANVAVTILLISVTFFVTDIKFKEQEEIFEKELEELTGLLENNIVVLQNLIKNVDDENERTSKELLELITDVRNESKESLEKAVSSLEEDIMDVEAKGGDLSGVIGESIHAVVSVITNKGQGSGAIIDEAGFIITNYHVVNNADSINVLTYDRMIYRADVAGFSEKYDIALLKINTNNALDDINFGDSDDVEIGETVVALGNPFGLDFTATQGIVSARRSFPSGVDYLQIDVPINPGNSGGPIINSDGVVIGITTLKISGGEGLGFALPSNDAEGITEQIITAFNQNN